MIHKARIIELVEGKLVAPGWSSIQVSDKQDGVVLIEINGAEERYDICVEDRKLKIGDEVSVSILYGRAHVVGA